MKFRGLKFLLFITSLYVILFFYDQNMTFASLKKSLIMFVEILPIFVLVIVTHFVFAALASLKICFYIIYKTLKGDGHEKNYLLGNWTCIVS